MAHPRPKKHRSSGSHVDPAHHGKPTKAQRREVKVLQTQLKKLRTRPKLVDQVDTLTTDRHATEHDFDLVLSQLRKAIAKAKGKH